MTRPALPTAWRERYVGLSVGRCIGKIEVTANRGQLVDYVQRRNGGQLGEFWCMDLVGANGRDAFAKAWPLLLSGSCQQQWEYAILKGARRTRAQFEAARKVDPMMVAGWIFLCIGTQEGAKHAHHTGIVGVIDETGALAVTVARGGWLTCEGNAADPKDPASRNGDGAYSGRERGHKDDSTEYEFIDPSGYL